MNMKKLCCALFVAASFGLMACGSDSSSSGSSDVISCKSEKTENSYKQVMKYNGSEATIDISIDEDGLMKTVMTGPIEDPSDCEMDEEDAEEFEDMMNIVCKDGKITTTMNVMIPLLGDNAEAIIKEAISNTAEEFEDECRAMDGKKVSDLEDVFED